MGGSALLCAGVGWAGQARAWWVWLSEASVTALPEALLGLKSGVWTHGLNWKHRKQSGGATRA